MPVTVRKVLGIAKDRCQQMQDIINKRLRQNGASSDDIRSFETLTNEIINEMFGGQSRHPGYIVALDEDVADRLDSDRHYLWIARDGSSERVMGLDGDQIIEGMVGYDVLIRDDEGGG